MSTSTNAAIYVRASAEPTALMLEAQEAICRRFAEDLGLNVVAVYSDTTSACVPLSERPGGAALLADRAAAQFDKLILANFSRLGRGSETLEVCDALQAGGCAIYVTNDTLIRPIGVEGRN